MNVQLPHGFDPFIQRLIDEGRFANQNEVLAEGLRLLQAQEQLRRDVRSGFDQLDRGEGIEEEEVYDTLERRISDIQQDPGGV